MPIKVANLMLLKKVAYISCNSLSSLRTSFDFLFLLINCLTAFGVIFSEKT